MSDLVCPNCGAPERYLIGHQITGVYDGVLFWSCMQCSRSWNPWPRDHRLRAIAQGHVEHMNTEVARRLVVAGQKVDDAATSADDQGQCPGSHTPVAVPA